ncbi:hypothetical protein F5Y16DRAFT_414903 [Xylariaceae sp. FL0255]|nr:hypothetical protein F5Y16DRAFT_414903 [Xylariaceae sp. FL0255]
MVITASEESIVLGGYPDNFLLGSTETLYGGFYSIIFGPLGTTFWNIDDAYAQFALGGMPESSIRIQLFNFSRFWNYILSFIHDPDSYDHLREGVLLPPRTSSRNHGAVGSSIEYLTDAYYNHQSDDELGKGDTTQEADASVWIDELLDSKTSKREKRFGLVDPAAWRKINQSLLQQERLSAIVENRNATAPSVPHHEPDVTPPSRTSSQCRALKHFTRELEKYAEISGAAGRAPIITPTISDSKASFHTVKPLVPYRDQFQAAGLAVTSKDQQQRTVRTSSLLLKDYSRTQPQHRCRPRQVNRGLNGHDDGTASGRSGSSSHDSSGTYLLFSSPSGSMMPPSVPQKSKKMKRHGLHAKQRLLPWFLNKPSNQKSSRPLKNPPFRVHHVKGGRVRPRNLPLPMYYHKRVQRRSHTPKMQTIPEVQYTLSPALPTKFVTPKKDPSLGIPPAQFEQKIRCLQEGSRNGHCPRTMNAQRSLEKSQGNSELTKPLLSVPCKASIQANQQPMEPLQLSAIHNSRNHCMHPEKQKDDLQSLACHYKRSEIMPSHPSKLTAPCPSLATDCTWSSLQQPLDTTGRRLNEDGRHTQIPSEHKIAGCIQPKNLEHELPKPREQVSHYRISEHALPRRHQKEESFIFVNRALPPLRKCDPNSKPLPPKPLLEHPPEAQVSSNEEPRVVQSQRTFAAPSPAVPPKFSERRKDAVAELCKAEAMLKDLDDYLRDHDDAEIKDRDVIKGLEVAIRAAADDVYDSYMRHKTGLRIRRFLADLRSFEAMQQPNPTGQRSKTQHAQDV